MPDFNIKPTHKPIKNYYTELEKYAQLGEENEGTVRAAFQTLLQHYCGQSDLTLLCEKSRYTPEKRRITLDGEVIDAFGVRVGNRSVSRQNRQTQRHRQRPKPRRRPTVHC